MAKIFKQIKIAKIGKKYLIYILNKFKYIENIVKVGQLIKNQLNYLKKG